MKIDAMFALKLKTKDFKKWKATEGGQGLHIEFMKMQRSRTVFNERKSSVTGMDLRYLLHRVYLLPSSGRGRRQRI